MARKPERHIAPKPPGFLFILLLVLMLAGCAGAPPRIVQLFWQLDVVRNVELQQQHEELSFFLLIDDADGIEDLREFRIIQEDAELSWTISADELRRIRREGEVWLGVNGVQMNDRSPLPRGDYLVEVIDKAGETDVSELFFGPEITGLTRGDLSGDLFPVVEKSGEASLRSAGEYTNVFLYNERGEFVSSETIDSAAAFSDLLQQWKGRDITGIWLQIDRPEAGYGLAAGPFSLED